MVGLRRDAAPPLARAHRHPARQRRDLTSRKHPFTMDDTHDGTHLVAYAWLTPLPPRPRFVVGVRVRSVSVTALVAVARAIVDVATPLR
jgi:hypothetical protein